jgi:hypothetical protein
MESALQVDLAKPEAPANQVLHTSLGDLARHASLSPVQTARGTPPNAQRGTVKGGSTTTTQIRLNPNVTEDRSSEDTELSNFEEKSNAFVLQPVDKGFGAWSYVASAFAMYIVVWGKYSPALQNPIVQRGPCLLASQVSLKHFPFSKRTSLPGNLPLTPNRLYCRCWLQVFRI